MVSHPPVGWPGPVLKTGIRFQEKRQKYARAITRSLVSSLLLSHWPKQGMQLRSDQVRRILPKGINISRHETMGPLV